MTAEHDPGKVASAGRERPRGAITVPEPERAPARVEPAPLDRRDTAFPVPAPRLALEALAPTAFALLYAAVLYRIWDVTWNIPIYEDRPDARQGIALFKGIHENGWWLHNPSLNWPFGQNYHDFPTGGETLQMVLAKVAMWVLPSPSAAMNVYYLLGFGVLALVTFLVLRHLRFGFVIASVVALIYTFLPYHFVHEQSHIFRSTYATAPLGFLVLLWAFSWRRRYLRDPAAPVRGRLRQSLRGDRVAVTVIVCVLIGITETMTTAFTMSLLAASAIVLAIRWREPERLLVAGALIGVLVMTFAVVQAPTLRFWLQEGRNASAGARNVAESEYYSLKISRLVLPEADHRVGAFGRFGAKAQEGSPLPTEGGQYLGLLGIAGFLAALIGLLGRGLRRSPRAGPEDRAWLTEHASLVVVLALLLGTVSGFNVVLAVAGFTQVRTWGRIEVILAFGCLVIVAIWFERLAVHLQGHLRRPVPALAALAVVVCAFGLLDGIRPAGRDYPAMRASWQNDETFVKGIIDTMPKGSAVFQFPAQKFPEAGPLERALDYDNFRGYIHDRGDRLRWSYGGIHGRPRADWQVKVRNQLGPIGALEPLLGLGYTGYWLDTFAFTPEAAEQQVNDINRTLKVKPLLSPDRRFYFWDLRPFKRRLGKSDRELRREATRTLGV
jgi:phosphoglycerol transferase